MNKNEKTDVSKLKSLLMSTHFLFYSFSICGIAILIIGLILGKKPIDQLSDIYLGTVMLLSLPWLILACIIVIKHKAIPKFGSNQYIARGGWAVFQGVFALGLLVYAEIYVLYIMMQ
jgi:hypothetical protein